MCKCDNIYNIPDIKNLNTSGSKSINDVFFYNQLAYLSTDFGIVVLNPSRREIKETYELQSNTTIAKISSFTLSQLQKICTLIATRSESYISSLVPRPKTIGLNILPRHLVLRHLPGPQPKTT